MLLVGMTLRAMGRATTCATRLTPTTAGLAEIARLHVNISTSALWKELGGFFDTSYSRMGWEKVVGGMEMIGRRQ